VVKEFVAGAGHEQQALVLHDEGALGARMVLEQARHPEIAPKHVPRAQFDRDRPRARLTFRRGFERGGHEKVVRGRALVARPSRLRAETSHGYSTMREFDGRHNGGGSMNEATNGGGSGRQAMQQDSVDVSETLRFTREMVAEAAARAKAMAARGLDITLKTDGTHVTDVAGRRSVFCATRFAPASPIMPS
jgi:hypothetical protein